MVDAVHTSPPSNQTRSTKFAERFDRHGVPPLGVRRILTQVLRDLIGTKDVQNAIMATYVWMADQVGHIALGALPTAVLCLVVYRSVSSGGLQTALYCISAVAVVAGWAVKERIDFTDVKSRANSTFPSGFYDVWWNVQTALFYFAVGAVIAAAPFIGGYAWLVLIVLLWPVLRIAFWWLRRKLAFQQAGLPYLYRLSDHPFKRENETSEQVDAVCELADFQNHPIRWLDVLFRRETPMLNRASKNHLVISGPVASGKTSLATAIGTEFAFALGRGRYLSAVKLLELLTRNNSGALPVEYDDGRFLWPLPNAEDSAQLVIIDDVDIGVAKTADPGRSSYRQLDPGEFEQRLRDLASNSPPLGLFSKCRTVWVVGDSGDWWNWQNVIAGLMGVNAADIMTVQLKGLPPGAPVRRAVVAPGQIWRTAGKGLGVVGAACLAVTALWWWREGEWGAFRELSRQEAFVDGSFGLELAPLKFFLAVSGTSAQSMQLSGGQSWSERFGFARREDARTGKCVKDAPYNLPLGFSVSNRLPGSATPVPVKFVGLTCAACHSAQVNNKAILGAATQSADLIGFQDAFANAVLDPNLDAQRIQTEYAKLGCPDDTPTVTGIGMIDRKIEAYLTDQWLSGFRAVFRKNAAKYDLAFHGKEILEAKNIPPGPSRSRPFRSIIRNALDFPAETNHAISKMPAVFMQKDKDWAQYDGSVKNGTLRSMIAVFASGTSIPALNDPQIADNVKKAAEFTLTLGQDPGVDKLTDLFPQMGNASPETLKKGEALYRKYCDSCHGHPERSGWSMPNAGAATITGVEAIGTDPARIDFRYSDMLPVAIWGLLPARELQSQLSAMSDLAARKASEGDFAQADWWNRFINATGTDYSSDIGDFMERSRHFPAGHRLAFDQHEITSQHDGQPRGYLNSPIPFVWLRAPYLHNGSVPTLRELLKPGTRRDRFCRGTHLGYDPNAVGIVVREIAPGQSCPPEAPFLFDQSLEGNSNKGHNIPDPADSVTDEDLEALLAYLRTV